jgi:hypothetical protein
MSKFCPMCGQVTNCTDNCKSCLEELENERKANPNSEFHKELILEQLEQM